MSLKNNSDVGHTLLLVHFLSQDIFKSSFPQTNLSLKFITMCETQHMLYYLPNAYAADTTTIPVMRSRKMTSN